MLFHDRHDAGRQLAGRLSRYKGRDAIVLALPRGGVPVGYEIARALDAALDVFVVRKLGVPGEEELAMGAIAPGGVIILNQHVVNALGITREEIDRIVAREQAELERRLRDYRGDASPPNVATRDAILVDDGLATGSSMRAAIAGLRQLKPARIVVAVPVGPVQVRDQLAAEAAEVVCAFTPDPFIAVGSWYRDFTQTTDEEVRDLLRLCRR